ncbi:MAG: hypothetical protein LHV69_11975, partial [Elusimicrobia bacterium]|nr:hypothetical protein [Candidatus Obscuribacterium magneticum]
TFSDLTESGTIRLYTLNATLVKQIPFDGTNAGIVTWDGRNSDGEAVASGVYFVHIESAGGEKRILKVGIER